jgi:hypothetical protein
MTRNIRHLIGGTGRDKFKPTYGVLEKQIAELKAEERLLEKSRRKLAKGITNIGVPVSQYRKSDEKFYYCSETEAVESWIKWSEKP